MKRFLNVAAVLGVLLVIAFCQLLCSVPLNFHSLAFILELILIALVIYLRLAIKKSDKGGKKDQLIIWSFPVLLIIIFIFCIIGTPYTGGLKDYKDQSKAEDADFAVIPQFDATQVQMVDKNTAIQLGDRVFGTLGSDEVSQYAVGDDWVQIAVNGKLYRVTPIDFGGLFKYLITKTTPGYIMVDCQSGDAQLVRREGLRYMKSAYFMSDLRRHMFFIDPTAMFAEARFEIDDQFEPHWIVPVLDCTWIGKTYDVKGIYVVSPYDGSHVYYAKDNVPEWVDNVYPVSVIYRQFAQSRRYANGLFNWSKKGVVEFTDDYAYVMFDDHVWIYTGVTSVGKDESNVGFAYIDLRSGDIRYIRKAGAEEYSARSSAQGAVQQYNYTAIFPSMVNIGNVPTYFMGLVDSANLIKSYAFVSYENYQVVAVGSSVQEAYDRYVTLIGKQDEDREQTETEEIVFTVADVRQSVIEGNTVVMMMDESGTIYRYDLSNGDLTAAFIDTGDRIRASAYGNGEIASFISITKE